jgi:hypothetical protein
MEPARLLHRFGEFPENAPLSDARGVTMDEAQSPPLLGGWS